MQLGTRDASKRIQRRYALDQVRFTYAPSALSLQSARVTANITHANSLLAINNPTQDLQSSEQEVAMAVAQFPEAQSLRHGDATAQAVLNALRHYSVLHFSCHGFADTNAPLNSGLLMTNDETVTLRDFFNTSLQRVRLVVLSACETGLPGTELPDEALSLPTGLLQAGVAGIAASLWAVPDFSTALLITYFYDQWRNHHLDLATALHEAQIWLRDTTINQKLDYLAPSLNGNGPIPVTTASWFTTELKKTNPKLHDTPTMAYPYCWAAFTYVGV